MPSDLEKVNGPPPPPPPPLPNLPSRSPSPPGKKKRLDDLHSAIVHVVPASEDVRFASKMLHGYLKHKWNSFKEDSIFVCLYNWVPSRIQDGPTCGLVALQIASKCFDRNITIEEILQVARSKKYTKQGEMFSAVHMAELAQNIYNCQTEVLHDGLSNRKQVLNHLINGGAVLIPYDIDHDFHPCCKRGLKAHWAILTGLVFKTSESHVDLSQLHTDEEESYLHHATSETMPQILQHMKDCDIYVCGKHGKSRHLGLWNFEQMKKSNENLYELNPEIAKNIEDYVVPEEGGRLTGLRGKVVLLFTGHI